MTVRRLISAVTVLLAVFVGGCSDRDASPLPAETDEPFYVQGKQLMKQGRNPEALTAFLKVIDRRGERGAAESHLEAGSIYLYQTKDPVEAYHHFRKYLELQPNSKEAVRVRGMVEAAKREFARTLPARPLDDQSQKLQSEDAILRLQRENDELRTQVQTLRSTASVPLSRSAPMITLPDEAQPRTSPPPVAQVIDTTAAATPTPRTTPANNQPSQQIQQPTMSQSTQPRASQPTRPATAGGRSHTVAPKETLYSISVKYYGNGKQVDAIYQANRNIMKSSTDLRPGMVLKIP
jgi:nucleoid-associated protein YgaU